MNPNLIEVSMKTNIPKTTKKKALDGNRAILAYGEVTGHAHAIETPDKVEHFESTDIAETKQFLRVKEECSVTHEEHAPIKLIPGEYEVRIQNQYQMGEIKRVID